MSGTAHLEASLTARQRRRLRLAREQGYLNAACRDPGQLLAAYARWCWRLRIPVVWSERCSPHSRYGRIHLDLYTTCTRLTAAAQAEMLDLAPHAAASPHDARWERIPVRDLDRFAAAVFRTSIRPANRLLTHDYPPPLAANLSFIDQPLAATA